MKLHILYLENAGDYHSKGETIECTTPGDGINEWQKQHKDFIFMGAYSDKMTTLTTKQELQNIKEV